MKISTLNIDWFKKSKNLKQIIVDEINKLDLDFLIVNENILNFKFDKNYFEYHSKPIPIEEEFQYLNYGIYLKNETPIRTSIYSKHQSIETIKTIDAYTSTCHKFIVNDRIIVIYGTIIGTWGIKYQNEIAKLEFENFKQDIRNISTDNDNFIIVGDFNTSFFEYEKRQLSTISSRSELLKFTDESKIYRATENIENCIDHIFISYKLKENSTFETSLFLENNILKEDPHKGIILKIDLKT